MTRTEEEFNLPFIYTEPEEQMASKPIDKLWAKVESRRKRDKETVFNVMAEHLKYNLAKHERIQGKRDFYNASALTIKDYLVENGNDVNYVSYKNNVKRVYYLSMEYLMGRSLCNAMINLGLYPVVKELLDDLGIDLDTLLSNESDAGLGNGGLGRLAACFMDSMATLGIPCYGYGLRYNYGIFTQKIKDGYQVESPDEWLRYGNPWEITKPELSYNVGIRGRVKEYMDGDGRLYYEWIDRNEVIALANDMLIPGYKNGVANNLRLWTAKAKHEFDLEAFNEGFYLKAVEQQGLAETISKVLYPNDNSARGKELRFTQEYFFVSATIQDIINRHLAMNDSPANLHEKAAIQLNDTHPALAIPELMRLLIDKYGFGWDEAWNVTKNTFAYTNHTVMPEAMEKWPVSMFEAVLPRHLQIIYEINRRFLNEVAAAFPGDNDRLRRMSLIEEGGEKSVRMAHLAVVGSHKVNGVAAIHSQILVDELFRDFAEMTPEKFVNKTNGITPRRWLLMSNPGLSDLISEKIGEGWITNLDELKGLLKYKEDDLFARKWHEVKQANKRRLADYVYKKMGIRLNLDSLFDCQVKRIHEYKRQLLNILHVITLYCYIKDNPHADVVPRTVIISGKAAAGYHQAKLIIKLINSVADVVNNDPDVGDKLKVVFLENYSVSLAELIIPAADLSEQISTAGTEASGTGNMKLSLNGALTIGTLDGANVEIREEVGDENIFIFGLTKDEVNRVKACGFSPIEAVQRNSSLKRCLDMLASGYFSKGDRELFKPILGSLLYQGDKFLLTLDYQSYVDCQREVSKAFKNRKAWTEMSIINSACMGKFSSDRTIKEYAEEIWHVKPITDELDKYRESK